METKAAAMIATTAITELINEQTANSDSANGISLDHPSINIIVEFSRASALYDALPDRMMRAVLKTTISSPIYSSRNMWVVIITIEER